MGARSASVILFRIVYSSLYTILLIFLILLLAVTPADHIYQTVSAGKFGNVFVVGGTYFVTAIIAFFIYASRLYTNRTALLAIPKPYLPIEDGELSKKVHKMTVKNRQRSALIAWESRPRDLRSLVHTDQPDLDEKDAVGAHGATQPQHQPVHQWILPFDYKDPPWGNIAHRGWSSPTSEQTPNLHFATVLAELPNLIEAKAVYSAPADPTLRFLAPPSSGQALLQSPPNPISVASLQRPFHMGLRDYVHHLETLGLINSPTIAETFVNRFEYARFSTIPLTELEFLDLMTAFSDLLEAMQPADLGVHHHKNALIQRDEGLDPIHTSSRSSVVHQRPGRPGSSTSSLHSSASVVHH